MLDISLEDFDGAVVCPDNERPSGAEIGGSPFNHPPEAPDADAPAQGTVEGTPIFDDSSEIVEPAELEV